MKTKLSVLTLIALLIINCTREDVDDISYGFIYGYVTSYSGDSPIAGAIIQCDGKTYTTGADGYYSIVDIPTGNNQITATKSDFETYSKTVNITKEGTEENVTMVSNIKGASVWGYVKKNSDGLPVIGASVTIAGMTDNTDANGRYQLPSIPEGNQNVQVVIDGYETYNQSFYMYSSDKQIDINLRKYHKEEFAINKDNYWSNFNGTGPNNEALSTGQYMDVNNLLYFHSNINIPNNSEVTSMNIQFYITDIDYTYNWDWKIATISENWDETSVTHYAPSCGLSYDAPFVEKTGNYISISIVDAYLNNMTDFLQNGFRMFVNDDKDYNWTVIIPSSEHSESNKRPKVFVTYLY